mgnify:CR=1 FL=1
MDDFYVQIVWGLARNLFEWVIVPTLVIIGLYITLSNAVIWGKRAIADIIESKTHGYLHLTLSLVALMCSIWLIYVLVGYAPLLYTSK